MGKLFKELCKGPVIVIDDRIDDDSDPIHKIIKEIKSSGLPIISYKTPDELRNDLENLFFSNFVILDWMFYEEVDSKTGAQPGTETEVANKENVIQLINELLKTCTAPIFVISNMDTNTILSELTGAGITGEDRARVFVEHKQKIGKKNGKFISRIEDWIKESPHVYLTKYWTNEWLSKNTKVFWELYALNPNWPALFYHSFEEDGEDPVLALRDTLFQLVFTEIDVSGIDVSFLDKKIEEESGEDSKESLRRLYERLVYTEKDIDKDVRPGDVFKKGDKYYLNIRPECDTTKRVRNPRIYLLEGEVKKFEDVKKQYNREYSEFRETVFQIIMPFLDENDVVVFNKRKLSIERYNSTMKRRKVCRVVPPFITRIRQNYSSFLGRFGVPKYPRQLLDSIYPEDGGVE